MLTLLTHPTFARLFAAQVVALLGTGLLTVGLALLAYDLAGAEAGVVLGTAFAIKMVAYVGLSPVVTALTARLPRRAVLIGADMVRAAAALALPFISEVWQIYLAIFVLQAASATFTPTFQATIPDVLPEEEDYTRALSLSRLAYDLESLLSPALAGLVLLVASFHSLFAGTCIGFILSAALIATTHIPAPQGERPRPFRERLTRGLRIYLATPRLRGLFALNLAAASAGAFVLVNTVVMVRAEYGMDETGVAVAMGAFGAGSMLAALALPRILTRIDDRREMQAAAAGLSALALATGLWISTAGWPGWPVTLGLWALIGLLYSAVLTPSGRLLRRSAHAEDRPAVFAAQFALSHLCWLVTYPLAGWSGSALGLGPSLALLGALAVTGFAATRLVWPNDETGAIPHEHPDLPPDHPHLREAHGRRHAHFFVIDDEHRAWPSQG